MVNSMQLDGKITVVTKQSECVWMRRIEKAEMSQKSPEFGRIIEKTQGGNDSW